MDIIKRIQKDFKKRKEIKLPMTYDILENQFYCIDFVERETGKSTIFVNIDRVTKFDASTHNNDDDMDFNDDYKIETIATLPIIALTPKKVISLTS